MKTSTLVTVRATLAVALVISLSAAGWAAENKQIAQDNNLSTAASRGRAEVYTDGITEARNNSETEYGGERLERLVSERRHLGPKELVHLCHADVSAFAATAKLRDNLTLLALRHL